MAPEDRKKLKQGTLRIVIFIITIIVLITALVLIFNQDDGSIQAPGQTPPSSTTEKV